MALYEKTNYTAGLSYLSNTFIYEYDISKCNINIYFSKGCIDQDLYNYLYRADRMVRQVYIGKLERDNPELKKIKARGVMEARKQLFEANNIQDREVLSIKNDAVFVINRQLQNTKFGIVEFVPKGVYTSFYKVNNLELYYYYNSINQEEYVEVKGIDNDKLQEKHGDYFLQLLKDIMYSIQVNGPEESMRMLKDFYMEYISLQLPIEYYRKFDNSCRFHLKTKTILNTGFDADNVEESDKGLIDTTYNLGILMQLQRILVSMYFNKH